MISIPRCISGNLWFVRPIDCNVEHHIFQSIYFPYTKQRIECSNTPEINCKVLLCTFLFRLQSVVAELGGEGEGLRYELQTVWKVDTHKCVDASPLLVRTTRPQQQQQQQQQQRQQQQHVLDILQQSPRSSSLALAHRNVFTSKTHSNSSSDISSTETSIAAISSVVAMESIATETITMETTEVVYFGSHSHLFLAVELMSGRVLWRTKLGDRVESSACSSVCGEYIIVGE